MNQQAIDSRSSTQAESPAPQMVVVKRIGTDETLLCFDAGVDPQSFMPVDRQRCAALDSAIGQAVRDGVDLRNADLSNRDLRYLNLAGLDLRGADLSGSALDGTLLTFANLADANLRGIRMMSGSLAHANLRGACLVGARFSQTDLTGALVWTESDESKRNGTKR
ncbi:pentapeptide repeat-containing protein [Paraburkholderia xenovorans]|uniref:pentapeptide repeat-containing protein n=1 Tax=Paraburkholderia xenovorans TaxID=36873 RepID=UPI0038BB9327